MKKIILAGFTGIFLLLVTSIAAKGQLASTTTQPSGGIISSKEPISNNVSVDRNNVNSKAVRNFVRLYKNVFNENWFVLQDGFVAMFNLHDIHYQVAYGKKGYWIYTIRNYDETKLPPYVRHLVKSSYYDYNITLVQEIETPLNSLTYIIHLEGKTRLINLRICDGEMEEWQKFDKSE